MCWGKRSLFGNAEEYIILSTRIACGVKMLAFYAQSIPSPPPQNVIIN